MSRSYASGTQVSSERTRIEMERLVLQYGADEFHTMVGKTQAGIAFTYQNYRIQMTVPLPDRDDERFAQTPSGRKSRTKEAAYKAWDAEVRRKWRSLGAVVKALLIAVEEEVMTFEKAFMPYILVGGKLVSEYVLPGLAKAIADGKDLSTIKQLPML